MNERSWLGATRPHGMITHLGDGASARKLRLLGVVCCRRIDSVMSHPQARTAVDVAERFADGLAGADELAGVHEAIDRPWWGVRPQQLLTAPTPLVQGVIGHCGSAAQNRAERKAQCDLIRDVFGNPFRPAAFDPGWRTDTAVSLARGMYAGRDFAAMPILADALQEAGCENDDILSHCRDPHGVHVRGCWVVDLVLGKA